MALCGHPLLFFVLCLSICPRPGGSHFQQSWQLFRIDRGRPSLQNPRFQAFRAQNRHFCALFAFGTPVLGHFEHKIEIFVRFCPLGPSFSGISSTKSGFLCSFTNGCWVGALSRRQRHRRTCGAIAPAQPLCHLPSPVAAYRRCRRCCRCYRHCTC